MRIRLHNSLSRSVEEFKSLKSGTANLYHCGPTVYNWAHIGNLRSYVFADVLRRALEYSGLEVLQVINITDIGHLSSEADMGDDKMVKGLKRENLPLSLEGLKQLADKYEKAFREDLKLLKIETPHHFPRATNYLKEEIELIKLLENKGFTYTLLDGIYFDTSKTQNYGRLGGLTPEKEASARLDTQKKNSRDFVLWKISRETHLGFESPWGKGFPGWHIECSAMSKKLLGQPFDIHTGGIDHIPIHHNNEIAQSEAAYDTLLANFWLHNEFVTVSDGPRHGEANKMAKSDGNDITLKALVDKGFSPLAYRYFLLLAHYRTPVNFSWEALEAAQNAYRKLKELVSVFPRGVKVSESYKNDFSAVISDDLNTPEALSLVWKLLRDEKVSDPDKHATLLDFDIVLGLDLEHNEFLHVPEDVVRLGERRREAKGRGDFKEADKIRKEIEDLGFEIRDTEGTFLIFKR